MIRIITIIIIISSICNSRMWTDSITKPTLILDSTKCRANIQRMADKATQNGLRLRPHAKTHQSAMVGQWFREVDNAIDGITVSSVDMAVYFAAHGWKDITIAFTVNVRQIPEINQLLGNTPGLKLGLLVESIDTVKILQDKLEYAVQVWIDVDTGYHRTGVDWQATGDIIALAQTIREAPITKLAGLLGHPGHTYKSTAFQEVETIHKETVQRMNSIRIVLIEKLNLSATERLIISLGDTPSCSMIQDWSGVDEIRPGNFVFYDVMQAHIGANRLEDVAVAVACPVIAKHPHLHQIVVYGGAVHLSKDRIVDERGRTLFGLLARPTVDGWEIMDDNLYVKGLSQEHGLIHIDENSSLMESTDVGDILLVVPIHSCLTANLLKNYIVLPEGDKVPMAPIPPSSDA